MFAHEDKIDEFFKDFIQAPIKWPEPEPPSKEWDGNVSLKQKIRHYFYHARTKHVHILLFGY
jgi:hypothetical protein